MKKASIGLVCLWLICLATACEFGSTNLDPTLTVDAEMKEILPGALVQTAHNIVSIGGRVSGVVVQHFKGVDAQPAGYNQYLIDERTLDAFWRSGLYGGAMKDCQILIEKATEADQPIYRGIAKVLMAINMGMATTIWGDVPFQDAFQGLNQLQPSYDRQSDIYLSIQDLLQTAIEDFHLAQKDPLYLADDLIFNGQTLPWIATAKALQARYQLHLSRKDPAASLKTLAFIRSGAFESLNSQPVFAFGKSLKEAHPLPLFSFDRPDQMVVGDYLYSYLRELNDPRFSRLIAIVGDTPIFHHPDSNQLYWGQFDAPLPFISLTELKFIEAEALLRTGAIDEAEEAFQMAVRANLQQLNLPEEITHDFIENKIHFRQATDFTARLQLLIRQKHLALFGQNPIEAWVDYRRTGFPRLTAPSDANPSFNPSLIVPRRCLYPISERRTNEINLNEAISRQGGHLLDTDLWIFQ